jgi:hypothetical protein
MLQSSYPWTKPLEAGNYTCAWCKREIKDTGVQVLATTADLPLKPLYETRHANGKCDARRYLFSRDSDGAVVYRYALAEVEFVWRPGTSQITVKGFGPEGDLNIGVRDLATGKIEIPNAMRPFVEKSEEWYADMNVKTCRHCEKDVHPNFAGVWLGEDDSPKCSENNGGEHSPMSN